MMVAGEDIMGKSGINEFQLILSILLIIVPSLVFGYFYKTAAMSIALFAGIVSAIMINIDKYEYFKVGQLEFERLTK